MSHNGPGRAYQVIELLSLVSNLVVLLTAFFQIVISLQHKKKVETEFRACRENVNDTLREIRNDFKLSRRDN